MVKGRIIMTALAATVVAALAPAAASAQSFGVYVGQSYPAYDYGRPTYGYGGPAYYQRGYDENQRERWQQHERWEQRARWEREEARRRYWQQERYEHRGDWHHGDDDDER